MERQGVGPHRRLPEATLENLSVTKDLLRFSLRMPKGALFL